MTKLSVSLLMILFFSIVFVQAQDEQPARLRIMQLSFIPESSATIDIQIDGAVIFDQISFPFATDYHEIAPGDYTLTTNISDQLDASASTMLSLQSGHTYSVVVSGNYAEQVTFVTIDETAELTDVTGSTAFVVNLTGQPITNITVQGERALDGIAAQEYSFLRLPATEFVISGQIGGTEYSETFNPHANTDFLIAVRLLPSGEPQIIYQRSSRLTIAEYLRSITEGAQFTRVSEFIAQTNLLDSLADDSTYTLFLPVNVVIDELAATGMTPDAAQWNNLLATHVTMQNLPPYALPQYPTLTTLAGNTVSINFGSTDSGYWEIEGAPIFWDVRLANGVIYGIGGIINPSR